MSRQLPRQPEEFTHVFIYTEVFDVCTGKKLLERRRGRNRKFAIASSHPPKTVVALEEKKNARACVHVSTYCMFRCVCMCV